MENIKIYRWNNYFIEGDETKLSVIQHGVTKVNINILEPPAKIFFKKHGGC